MCDFAANYTGFEYFLHEIIFVNLVSCHTLIKAQAYLSRGLLYFKILEQCKPVLFYSHSYLLKNHHKAKHQVTLYMISTD